ncbi:hypothetical protein [Stenotrophomonas maltophilia]|jgi:hypothetical protein|uniref:hypothetical protein n=1 Tax=Stenotrophomonas maltophilia TaxID=40324 RepID=UPI0012B0DD0C|nr:hypothetical protein [Stenotrophomonas maltophilia]ELC7364811.1 hypothetical protein [Stenotrophomonas maltophilia]MBA0250438.1 hypothetical protein [Stenotrophomonas maltophilia]MBA0321320.1 hypothetical protein [Stenotrophomonas maltophilia]MBH1629402.1 hypothetical protein [Stenotrophomonas maltophilia]MCI1133814.1 hypothetical protein [Stenotrophomonas maltophilia]
MYRWVSRFISYRTFYVWRARFYYHTRHLDVWMLASVLCFLGVVALLWYYWRFTNVPLPRMHPQVAALRVEGITNEAIHRIVLVRHGGTPPGKPFSTPEEIRASTVRTMRVRQVLDGEVAWRLKANLLADIADYIEATAGCVPYQCTRVQAHISQLREAATENAGINRALQPILDGPRDLVPGLTSVDRQRVKSGWSDSFSDIFHQVWLLNDLQTMHARMMAEYPKRAPAPWLPEWLIGPEPTTSNGMPL